MERTRALIVSRFKSWWDALEPLPPLRIVYDNLKGKPDAAAAWARVSVLQGRNYPPFVGTTRKRCEGSLTLQLFLPEETGVTLATSVAQLMQDRFDDATETATDGGGVQTVVLFRTVSLLLVASKDGYQQHNAYADFQRDTIQPA